MCRYILGYPITHKTVTLELNNNTVGSFTCIGVLVAANLVNPTMSLKYIVTQSKLSAWTLSPRFNASATVLRQ